MWSGTAISLSLCPGGLICPPDQAAGHFITNPESRLPPDLCHKEETEAQEVARLTQEPGLINRTTETQTQAAKAIE